VEKAGAVYQGGWREGLCDGFGVSVAAVDKEEWERALRVGWGGEIKGDVDQLLSQNEGGSVGEHYRGLWRAGLRHGHGRTQFPNGEWYEGEYVDDQPHGHGTYQFADGSQYAGEWARGMLTICTTVTDPGRQAPTPVVCCIHSHLVATWSRRLALQLRAGV
jgi:hypothetical protein